METGTWLVGTWRDVLETAVATADGYAVRHFMEASSVHPSDRRAGDAVHGVVDAVAFAGVPSRDEGEAVAPPWRVRFFPPGEFVAR